MHAELRTLADALGESLSGMPTLHIVDRQCPWGTVPHTRPCLLLQAMQELAESSRQPHRTRAQRYWREGWEFRQRRRMRVMVAATGKAA